jgi:Telomere resolvase
MTLNRTNIIQVYRERIQIGQRFRLSKSELEVLIEGFIESLIDADRDEIQALCESEIALLEQGYPQASVAKYITRYRKKIANRIEDGTLALTPANSHVYIHQQRVTGKREERLEHWALSYLKYTAEVYERIDKRSQQVNRDKQLNLRLVPVERYLSLLRQMLSKKGQFEARWLATAIAGLTGRRFAEVMAKGSFSLSSHPHLLRFEGQLKSRGERAQGYDIITLFPAAEVIETIERLRRLPEVVEIASLEGESLLTALNAFNQKLNHICGKTLSEIVPPLEGKKGVSIHNLRSLYGAIAVYFFCPPLHHEYAFVQHFLGHVMDSPATGHYFRYALCDDQHNLIRSKGILVDRFAPLPIGSAEDVSEALSEDIQTDKEADELDVENVGIEHFEDLPLFTQRIQLTQQHPNPMEVELQTLQREWRKDLNFQVDLLKREFEERILEIEQDGNASWFLRRVKTLERENVRLRQERDWAVERSQAQAHEELMQLRAQHQTLETELQKAQAKLEGFRKLLS